MSELVNLMSGISGVTIQARDIAGGLHFHLTVVDPADTDVARRVELDGQTAAALATVLRDLDACLTAAGVPDTALPTAVDQVSRALLLQFHRDVDPGPRQRSVPFDPKLRRLARDLAAFVEPERLLAQRFYFSTRKVVAFHRAYEHRLAEEVPPDPVRRFLALHRYFRARGRLVFGPVALSPGAPPPDEDQWVYFTGEFTMTRDDSALDRVHGAREALDSGRTHELFNIVTSVFGVADPFFYPYVEFRGRVGAVDVVMTASRKHLELDSHTVATLAGALRRFPLSVAGFGTFETADPDGPRLQPILFRADH